MFDRPTPWHIGRWVQRRLKQLWTRGGGPPQRCIRREGTSVAVQEAVGGGYCRLQMPLKLAFAARETVAGHRLGVLEVGRGGALPMHPGPAPVSSRPLPAHPLRPWDRRP